MNDLRIFMKLAMVTLLMMVHGWNPTHAQIIEREHWDIRATIEWESAYRTTESDFQKTEWLALPELNADLPFNTRLRGIGRLRADAFDELEPGQPPQHELGDLNKKTYIGDHLNVELRELFIDLYVGPVFVKAGKQQIVWGKTDGLKLLDVINPQNFREFVLDDFEDSRIPLWSLLAEVPAGEIMVQAVWIPDRSYHKLPARGADFRFRAPEFAIGLPDGFQATINSVERPGDFIKDSDVGLRLSTFWKGWDLTLNYLYHYYDIPVVTRSIQIEPARQVVIDQKYRRSHLAGFTFSNAFGNVTLHGETAFSVDRYFRTKTLSDSDGTKKSNTLDYAIGLDWFGFDDMLVSVQLFQNWILRDQVESLFRERVDTRATLLVERTFMNELLEIEMLAVAGINEADGFIQSKVIYEWKSNVNIWAGFDGFWGDREDLIGQFNRQDRILWGMEIGL
ncbi:MAG: DUF1302 family protein [Balneolaceae bacterium]|nr:DUF1302 family protein [Balneolaceae bacterium]